MSTTLTETYRFLNIPIQASGKETVATVSGEVAWKIADEGDRWSIHTVFHLMLSATSGALVEILHNEPVYDTVVEALRPILKEHMRNRSRPVEETAPAFIETTSGLDNAAVEGAKQTSG